MKNLKEVRMRNKLTQAEMAKILNISQPVYSRWENSTFEPSLKHLINISQKFNVSVDYLLGNDRTQVLNLSFVSDAKRKTINLILNANEDELAQFLAYFSGLNIGKNLQLENLLNNKNFDNNFFYNNDTK